MIGNTSLFDKHKNNLLLFFVFILISNNVYSDNMIIDDIENSNSSAEQKDYCENTVTKWCFVTDKVMNWMQENNFDNSNTTFYSDSFNDLPLLEAVNQPIVVDGDDKLIEEAKKNDWQYISFR